MQAAHVYDVRKEGFAQGLSVGDDNVTQLISRFIADGRFDLIERVVNNQLFREELYY